jgi:hypothetical protein
MEAELDRAFHRLVQRPNLTQSKCLTGRVLSSLAAMRAEIRSRVGVRDRSAPML